MTPSVAIIRIYNAHWRGLRLWLPLFLLWIPLLVLAPLLVPVLLIVLMARRVPAADVFRCAWGLVAGLRGVEVDVCTQGNHVLVRIV